jgi:predicted anti-sigma-YlaC factor YlaD
MEDIKMQCQDILKALDLYLEGDEADLTCAAFREHLIGCERCRIVVDTMRNTVTLFKGTGEQMTMPDECQKRLHEKLKHKWENKE